MAKLTKPFKEEDFKPLNISETNKSETTIGNEGKLTEYIEKMVTKERKEQARLNARFSDSIVVR